MLGTMLFTSTRRNRIIAACRVLVSARRSCLVAAMLVMRSASAVVSGAAGVVLPRSLRANRRRTLMTRGVVAVVTAQHRSLSRRRRRRKIVAVVAVARCCAAAEAPLPPTLCPTLCPHPFPPLQYCKREPHQHCHRIVLGNGIIQWGKLNWSFFYATLFACCFLLLRSATTV